MEDRQSTNPGRVKFTLEDGTVMYGKLERADGPTVAGTPINKSTLFNNLNSERYAAELPSEAFELLTKEWDVSVPVSDWTIDVNEEGYYTQTINVEGMSEKYSPMFSLIFTDANSSWDVENAFSLLRRMTTYDGYVVFKAVEIPVVDFSVKLKGV